MDKELQAYYEARFSMFIEKGWKDLIEDVQKMLDATNDIASIQDEKTLHFRRGELSIMRWLIGLEPMSRAAYDELQAEKEEEIESAS